MSAHGSEGWQTVILSRCYDELKHVCIIDSSNSCAKHLETKHFSRSTLGVLLLSICLYPLFFLLFALQAFVLGSQLGADALLDLLRPVGIARIDCADDLQEWLQPQQASNDASVISKGEEGQC